MCSYLILCLVRWTVIDLYLDLLSIVLQATGGSAIKAVEVLMEHGVPEERIIFINLVSHSPARLSTLHSTWFC